MYRVPFIILTYAVKSNIISQKQNILINIMNVKRFGVSRKCDVLGVLLNNNHGR